MSLGLYILDENKNPIPVENPEWGIWMEKHERHVADERFDGSRVSTVFLGLDHSYDGGEPVLWETMVFGGPLDLEQDRCSGTWQDAEAMHARMVERVKASLVSI